MGIHCETCKCPPPLSKGHVPCPGCKYPTAKSFIDESPLHLCETCTKKEYKKEKQEQEEATNVRKIHG